ncbi:hypothetical protein NXY56_007614 [Leishmania guyanensis]|uniref:Uncharacterized protein n=1 Tax=Leishmania guyanensis TaxID=5670 RepID=A0A1E1J712_LEIGU|nr:hypothetical protein BN36_3568690 [Leishmania guyanensis]
MQAITPIQTEPLLSAYQDSHNCFAAVLADVDRLLKKMKARQATMKQRMAVDQQCFDQLTQDTQEQEDALPNALCWIHWRQAAAQMQVTNLPRHRALLVTDTRRQYTVE